MMMQKRKTRQKRVHTMLCHLYKNSKNTNTLIETESRSELREVQEETDYRRARGNSGGRVMGMLIVSTMVMFHVYMSKLINQIVPFKCCRLLHVIYIFFKIFVRVGAGLMTHAREQDLRCSHLCLNKALRKRKPAVHSGSTSYLLVCKIPPFGSTLH